MDSQELFDRLAAHPRGAIAFIHRDVWMTYGELLDRVRNTITDIDEAGASNSSILFCVRDLRRQMAGILAALATGSSIVMGHHYDKPFRLRQWADSKEAKFILEDADKDLASEIGLRGLPAAPRGQPSAQVEQKLAGNGLVTGAVFAWLRPGIREGRAPLSPYTWSTLYRDWTCALGATPPNARVGLTGLHSRTDFLGVLMALAHGCCVVMLGQKQLKRDVLGHGVQSLVLSARSAQALLDEGGLVVGSSALEYRITTSAPVPWLAQKLAARSQGSSMIIWFCPKIGWLSDCALSAACLRPGFMGAIRPGLEIENEPDVYPAEPAQSSRHLRFRYAHSHGGGGSDSSAPWLDSDGLGRIENDGAYLNGTRATSYEFWPGQLLDPEFLAQVIRLERGVQDVVIMPGHECQLTVFVWGREIDLDATRGACLAVLPLGVGLTVICLGDGTRGMARHLRSVLQGVVADQQADR